jgi:hypothetical protein
MHSKSPSAYGVRRATEHPRPLPDFITASTTWASFLLRPVGLLHNHLDNLLARMGAFGSFLRRDHLFFFFLASAGLMVLLPRYLILGSYVIERFALGMAAPKPDTSHFPYAPNIVPASVALFLLTFFVERRHRLAVLLVLSVPFGIFIDGWTDTPSLAAYVGFLGVVYGFAHLPIRRWLAAMSVCLLAVGFMVFCRSSAHLADHRIAELTVFHATFLPMLWYSVYEHLPPKKTLSPWTLLGYNYCRFFGCPVFTYADLFSKPTIPLDRIRFDGIKALYVSGFLSIAHWASGEVRDAFPLDQLRGLALLLMSYVTYVGQYAEIAIGFNVVIGILRLFGVPVRDNFHYWLLARTPNEHWRRWNVLLREWIITFVFFPIMRARRWLFVAVMASLATSGLLHVIPELILGRGDAFHVAAGIAYWTINGVAIYLVVKIPQLFPRLIKKLHMGSSVIWDFAGVVATSAFFGILVVACKETQSWTEVVDYFVRLFVLV